MSDPNPTAILVILVLAIAGWSLTLLLSINKRVAQIAQSLYGAPDNGDGLVKEHRRTRSRVHRLEQFIQRQEALVEALHERMGLPAPPRFEARSSEVGDSE